MLYTRRLAVSRSAERFVATGSCSARVRRGATSKSIASKESVGAGEAFDKASFGLFSFSTRFTGSFFFFDKVLVWVEESEVRLQATHLNVNRIDQNSNGTSTVLAVVGATHMLHALTSSAKSRAFSANAALSLASARFLIGSLATSAADDCSATAGRLPTQVGDSSIDVCPVT